MLVLPSVELACKQPKSTMRMEVGFFMPSLDDQQIYFGQLFSDISMLSFLMNPI